MAMPMASLRKVTISDEHVDCGRGANGARSMRN
jgi:hypothetical protein